MELRLSSSLPSDITSDAALGKHFNLSVHGAVKYVTGHSDRYVCVTVLALEPYLLQLRD